MLYDQQTEQANTSTFTKLVSKWQNIGISKKIQDVSKHMHSRKSSKEIGQR